MARKSLKVEGMTASEIEHRLNTAATAIGQVRYMLIDVEGALPTRDYQSITTHLDKALETLEKRIDIAAKAVCAEATRAEKKEIDAKIKEALSDPEKAEALRELLNL